MKEKKLKLDNKLFWIDGVFYKLRPATKKEIKKHHKKMGVNF